MYKTDSEINPLKSSDKIKFNESFVLESMRAGADPNSVSIVMQVLVPSEITFFSVPPPFNKSPMVFDDPPIDESEDGWQFHVVLPISTEKITEYRIFNIKKMWENEELREQVFQDNIGP